MEAREDRLLQRRSRPASGRAGTESRPRLDRHARAPARRCQVARGLAHTSAGSRPSPRESSRCGFPIPSRGSPPPSWARRWTCPPSASSSRPSPKGATPEAVYEATVVFLMKDADSARIFRPALRLAWYAIARGLLGAEEGSGRSRARPSAPLRPRRGHVPSLGDRPSGAGISPEPSSLCAAASPEPAAAASEAPEDASRGAARGASRGSTPGKASPDAKAAARSTSPSAKGIEGSVKEL